MCAAERLLPRCLRLAATVMLLACGARQLRPGETEDLTDGNGRRIGQIRQISAQEREYLVDRDQDGRIEHRFVTQLDQISTLERFDPSSGRLLTRSYYFQGVLNRVEVFNEQGEIRGIVNYPDGKTARSVELPRSKRLVEFIPR